MPTTLPEALPEERTSPAIPLAHFVAVSPRFLRSVNLGRDFYGPHPLHGYILTASAAASLERIAAGIEHAPARAWSITGSYGSGKSAFALFAAKALATPASGAEAARSHALRQQPGLKPEVFGEEKQGFWPVLVTGGREPLARALVRGLCDALNRLPEPKAKAVLKELRAKWGAELEAENLTAQAVSDLYAAAAAIARKRSASCRGLLLVIDELGKFLEYAALHPEQGDMQVLQELAEYAVRSADAPLLLITILHQAFEEYAHRLSATQRGEWQKVQGRFSDIPFGGAAHETMLLLSRALDVTEEPEILPSGAAGDEHALLRPAIERHSEECHRLGLVPAGMTDREWRDMMWNVYPLHFLCVLAMPHLFRRFGQNERSLFSFLASAEPHGFQEFVSAHGIAPDAVPRLRLDHLYDYAVEAFGSTLYTHPTARLWSEAEEALFRLRHSDPLHSRLIKTIALLNILGEGTRLKPSKEILRFALEDETTTQQQIDAALESLQDTTLIVYRQFKGAYRLFEGSDLDIESLLIERRRHYAHHVDVVKTAAQIEISPPLVARRHSFETGALRFFEVRPCRPATLETEIARRPPQADGLLLLCLARDADELAQAERLVCSLLAGQSHTIVGLNRETETLREAAIAVESLLAVQDEQTSQLQKDRVAKREVQERLMEATRALQAEWERLMRPQNAAHECSVWYFQGRPTALSSYRDLQALISTACERMYPHTPRLLNELVNRRQLSSTAAAARRNLIEAMITHRAQPRLGMTGFPPEMSMYASLLGSTGIHRPDKAGAWTLQPPPAAKDAGLARVWQAIEEFLFGPLLMRQPLAKLNERLREPPYGLMDGVIPILLGAVLLHHENEVAVYEEDRFITDLDAATFERMIKRPEDFSLQGCRIAGERQAVLDRFAKGMLRPNEEKTLVNVARRLYREFNRLPDYTLKTRALDASARALRDLFKEGKEPEQLLFVDLPRLLGTKPFSDSGGEPKNIAAFFARWNTTMSTVMGAYDALLSRVEKTLCDRFSVGQWQELRARSATVLPYVTEPRLKAFALRASDENLERQPWLESVAAGVIGRPPSGWSDADEDRFQLELAPLVSALHHAELIVFERQTASAEERVGLRLSVTSDTGAENARVVLVSKTESGKIERLTHDLLQAFEELAGDEPQDVRVAVIGQAVKEILRGDNDERATRAA